MNTAKGYLTIYKIKADGERELLFEDVPNFMIESQSYANGNLFLRMLETGQFPDIEVPVDGIWEVDEDRVLKRISGEGSLLGLINGWVVFNDGSIVKLPSSILNPGININNVTVFDGHNLPLIKPFVSPQGVKGYRGTGLIPCRGETCGSPFEIVQELIQDQLKVSVRYEKFLFSPASTHFNLVGFAGATSGTGSTVSPQLLVKLPAPVFINKNEQVEATYTAIREVRNRPFGDLVKLSEIVERWPFEYKITNLIKNDTLVSVTLDTVDNIHFIVGDIINVNVIPMTFNLISLTSDVDGVWTIDRSGSDPHGLDAGDIIVIEDTSNPDYWGEHTVSEKVNQYIFKIDDGRDLGLTSGGTYRFRTQTNYYGGVNTITEINGNVVTFENPSDNPSPDISSALLTSPDEAETYAWGRASSLGSSSFTKDVVYGSPANNFGGGFNGCRMMLLNTAQLTAMGIPDSKHSVLPNLSNTYLKDTGITIPNLQMLIAPEESPTSGGGVNGFERIAAIVYGPNVNLDTNSAAGALLVVFRTPQPKHHEWSLIINPLPAHVRRNYFPDFPNFPEPL